MGREGPPEARRFVRTASTDAERLAHPLAPLCPEQGCGLGMLQASGGSGSTLGFLWLVLSWQQGSN